MPDVPQDQHPLERRATALAEGFTKRVDLMAAMMRPEDRPVFHQRLSERDAIDFWRKHRYDDLGQKTLSTWRPDQILSLDQRLAQANASDGLEAPLSGPTVAG